MKRIAGFALTAVAAVLLMATEYPNGAGLPGTVGGLPPSTIAGSILTGSAGTFAEETGLRVAAGGGTITTTATTLTFMANALQALKIDGANGTTTLGQGALDSLTVGSGLNNTAMGLNAGTEITTGDGNTVIGVGAGDAITTALNNTLIGLNAGGGLTTSGAAANANVFVGYSVASAATGATQDVGVGSQSLNSLTVGDNNTALGLLSGGEITTGSGNTNLGYLSDVEANNDTDSVSIGNAAKAGTDAVALGHSASAPDNTLAIAYGGAEQITGTTSTVTFAPDVEVSGDITTAGGNFQAGNGTFYGAAASGARLYGSASAITAANVFGVYLGFIGTSTQTSGSNGLVSILGTYNQASGTAANTDLLIRRTETALGSGAQYLIDAGTVAGGSLWNVDNGGRTTVVGASAASDPAELLSGAIYSGGTGTTNFPHFMIRPSAATASSTWDTSGTAFGINLDIAAGMFADWKVDGVTKFSVSTASNGTLQMGTSGVSLSGNGVISGAATVNPPATTGPITLFSLTNTSTSGAINPVRIVPTYNQASGTAANTDLLIRRTETALGSGAQNLIDAGTVAGGSKFAVSNTGLVTSAGPTMRTATQTVTDTTTLAADNTLVTPSLPAGTKIKFRLQFFATTVATSGIKLDFGGGSATFTSFNAAGDIEDLSTVTVGARAHMTSSTTPVFLTITGTDTMVVVEGAAQIANAGTLGIQFAQNAETIAAESVIAGVNSSLTVTIIP